MTAVAGVGVEAPYRGLTDERTVVGGHRVLSALNDPARRSSAPNIAPERCEACHGDRTLGIQETKDKSMIGGNVLHWRAWRRARIGEQDRGALESWAPVSSGVLI